MSTIPQVFEQAVARYAERPALLEPGDGNALTQLTYQQLQLRVQAFAGYLQQKELAQGDRLMIWSSSCINWLVAYLGAMHLGLVVVPLDVNSREDFIQRLIDTTEARFLLTTRKQYEGLRTVTLPLIDIEQLPEGSFDPNAIPEIKGDDLAELVFTSGTTGQPKGVMLSHHNIASNARAAIEAVTIYPEDRTLAILPLSHMFELTIELVILHSGASIVYARNLSPDTIFQLLTTQQVSAMVLVPQALQLFMNGIEREVRRKKKEKQWELLHTIAARLPFGMRRLLFKTVHKRMGGRFRLFVSGGAALPPALGRRWENMGIRVLQGFGATECAPFISVTKHNDHTSGSAGQALPGIEIRIADDGEILVKGPNVAQGYWQNSEATTAAFHDGWYHTGDLGHLDRHNNLYIKGRKKNIIVLANGMNVYPEDIEAILIQQPAVKDTIVLGLEKVHGDPEVHAVLLMDDPTSAKTAVQATNRQLASHQQIRGYTLWPEKDFPCTHTLKVKRQEVLAKVLEIRQEK